MKQEERTYDKMVNGREKKDKLQKNEKKREKEQEKVSVYTCICACASVRVITCLRARVYLEAFENVRVSMRDCRVKSVRVFRACVLGACLRERGGAASQVVSPA